MIIVDKEKDNQIRNNSEPIYKKKLGFIQKLIQPDNDSVEYSFEEIRARAYYPIYKEREKVQKELNDLKKQ